ncbi:MAG TPA: ABC transporter ATP-binding protein [Gemmatimonadales bacterium]|nr:ABC transporter ATP-binding protein [Gemmatimonadales bacterium]
MIEISGLSKSFGRVTVLDGLDLKVEPGRVMGVVGPNAVGKTTLLKLVLGLMRPDAGRIVVDGREADGNGAYRARLGYMSQITAFPERLTGYDCLALLKDLRGAAAELDEELIGRFNLAGHLEKPLRTLSGGTRQKVNAVMAFLFNPAVIILDEPTASLDPLSSSILKDKIAAERSRGRTILVSSHLMGELEELADDVAVLLDGRVRFVGEVDRIKRLTRQPNLERAVAQMMIREVAA